MVVVLVVQGTRVRRVLLVLRVRLGLQALQAHLDRVPPLEADQVTSHKLPTSHLVVAIRRCFRLVQIRVPTLAHRQRPLPRTSLSSGGG